MPDEPLPPPRDLVNLGIVLDMPFLHQLVRPGVLTTTVDSSLVGTSTGQTMYTLAGPLLTKSVFSGSSCEKIIEYHYAPSDPVAKLEVFEDEVARLKSERKQASKAKDRELAAQLAEKIKLVEGERKRLKKQLKAGSAPSMQLVRTTSHESREGGEVQVTGETIFEYDGSDIIKATSTFTTDEDPPRIAELCRNYAYNFLGQIESSEMFGCVTEYQYDPLGRLISSGGRFVSPTGDFVSEEHTIYTYTPPGSDPLPGNALIASVADSKSGPAAVVAQVPAEVPAEVGALSGSGDAPAPPSELPEPVQLPEATATQVIGAYVYA